jgi:hypothetical protein
VTFDQAVFEPDAAWKRALEKFGAATHLTVELYDRDGRDPGLESLGQAHPTSLFDLLAPGGGWIEHKGGGRVRRLTFL